MKLKISLFLFLISGLFIIACNEELTKPIVPRQIEKLNVSEDLIGTWVFEEYEDDITVNVKIKRA